MKTRSKNHAVNAALGDIRASAEAAKKITRIGQAVDFWRNDCFERLAVLSLPVQNVATGRWWVGLSGGAELVECTRLQIPATVEIEWHDARILKPDDSITVIVGFHDGDSEDGWYDSALGTWRNALGDRYEDDAVVAWAEKPEVPARFVKMESEVAK